VRFRARGGSLKVVLGLLLAGAVVFALVQFGIDKLNEPGPTAAEQSGLQLSNDPPPVVPSTVVGEDCVQVHRDVTNAERTYYAQNFRYADIPTLVRAGNLVEASPLYTAETTDGWVTYRLVGHGGCPSTGL
jgi:hypothetical protein